MEKVKIRNLPFVYPVPAVLVGAKVNEKANYNTLGNCGIISIEPAVIYISSEKSHYTNIGIKENGYFSVNIPSVSMMEQVDYCGMVTGHSTDKSNVFTLFYGEIACVPMIKECPINLSCKVINSLEVYDMDIFIGEVIEVYSSEECLTDGIPDTKKIDPLIYMMDNLYWNIGNVVGTGFSAGSNYIKS